jgi:hypothetical protein
MSNSNATPFPDFGKLVPGFDFLQNLAKQAGSATQAIPQLPNIANWIAPTLSVEELDKRIQELKTVQFWLDQNAAALKATITALEVQKMTLATLKGMNFNMNEVANAFKLKVGDSMNAMGAMQRAADKPADKPDKSSAFPGLEIPPSIYQANKAQSEAEPEAPAKAEAPKAQAGEAPAAATGLVDPMQWWGALTQQFQTIAAEALKEAAKTTALEPAKHLATDMAKEAVKTAADMAKGMAETATKTMADGARVAMNNPLVGSWSKPETEKPSPKATPKPAAAKTAASTSAAAKAAPKTEDKPKAPAPKTAGAAARKTTR